MKSREREYAEWLAVRRGVSLDEAMAAATAPRPRPYAPAPKPFVPCWDNVIGLGPRPPSVLECYERRYGRRYGAEPC